MIGTYTGRRNVCFIGLEHGPPLSDAVRTCECNSCLAPAPPPPPPPPPPPQIFHNLVMGSAPVVTIDVASTTAWTLTLSGAPPVNTTPRFVVVPGGGFSSDLQPKPWIDSSTCGN